MNPLDTEAQFYPFISTAIRGNEGSFHGDSSNPPPLSSIWDIQFNP